VDPSPTPIYLTLRAALEKFVDLIAKGFKGIAKRSAVNGFPLRGYRWVADSSKHIAERAGSAYRHRDGCRIVAEYHFSLRRARAALRTLSLRRFRVIVSMRFLPSL
jgi:hypothetical protein